MSQDNLFSTSFQPPSQSIFDPGLYSTDISLQFASSVPQPQYNLHFPHASYQSPGMSSSQDSNKPHQSKAERRAEHNATERARRENLNAKFQQLAHTLPNLQNDSRNSKSTIIDRTLDYIKNSVVKEEQMNNRIKELERFNHLLLSQLDERTTKRTRPNLESTPSPIVSVEEVPCMKKQVMFYDLGVKFPEDPTFVPFLDQRQFN